MENTLHSLMHTEPCLLQRDNVSFVWWIWCILDKLLSFHLIKHEELLHVLTFTTLMTNDWHQVYSAKSWKANLWSLDVIVKSFEVAGKYLNCDGCVNFWLSLFPSKLWQLSPFRLKTMEKAEGFSSRRVTTWIALCGRDERIFNALSLTRWRKGSNCMLAVI